MYIFFTDTEPYLWQGLFCFHINHRKFWFQLYEAFGLRLTGFKQTIEILRFTRCWPWINSNLPCESIVIKGSVEITPLMCSFLTCFSTWLRISRFKKCLLFFSPCSCHRALARSIIPSTFYSYTASRSCLHFSSARRVILQGLLKGFPWNIRTASW